MTTSKETKEVKSTKVDAKQIKEQRIDIDILIAHAKQLDSSNRVEQTIASLEMSKAWLGQVLKGLGEENPYPKSEDGNSNKIEKQTEKFIGEVVWEETPTGVDVHISRVKQLRAKIETEVQSVTKLTTLPSTSISYFASVSQSLNHLIEAKMWLGYELDRIRG